LSCAQAADLLLKTFRPSPFVQASRPCVGRGRRGAARLALSGGCTVNQWGGNDELVFDGASFT